MNGPYPEITNISFLAKLFFKTFISLKHLSDYRTVGLSDRRTVGLSDCRIIATAPIFLMEMTKHIIFSTLYSILKQVIALFVTLVSSMLLT